MSEEPGQGKLHDVGDEEADAVIAFCEHAIPHNEAIGRVLRNMYRRLQTVETELASLKAAKPKRSGP